MMNRPGAQKLISFLVNSGLHMCVTYAYYQSKRKIYFNNDVYYKICIVSILG